MQVDLFFYREPEEAKQQEEDEAPAAPEYAITDFNATTIGGLPADGQWPAAIDQPWTEAVPPPIPAVPGVSWTPDAGKNYYPNFGSFLCFIYNLDWNSCLILIMVPPCRYP